MGNALDKDALARMFGLRHAPKYKKFLKKCKAHKLSQMPSELKKLLLDNKKKKRQKAELIQRIADKEYDEDRKEKLKTRFADEDTPSWFAEAFADRTDHGGDDGQIQVQAQGDGKKEKAEVDEWLESEEDEDANDVEADDLNDDDA